MDLKDFVSASLLQIVQGVADSAKAISDLGGAVNPAFSPSASGTHVGQSQDGSAAPVYAVAFDVAVIVSNTGSGEAGAKLQVASFLSIGGKASASDKHETTSRIKFSVPLQLPTDEQSKAAAQKAAEVASAKRAERRQRLSRGIA
jgi:hypothetical protein